jgi:sugar phosphate isomerase/epimerase
MLRVSISERTTFRWDLADELDALHQHGFDTLSIWRPKLSDLERGVARQMLDAAGVRVSSLQWAGGFTGSEGHTFQESLADAREAIYEAVDLGTDVLLLHTGCRGGHTLGHARRLVLESLEKLAPLAEEHGVRLALKPTHPAASSGCGFFSDLQETLEFVEQVQHPCIGLALDLWHFGHQPDLLPLLPRLRDHLMLVSLADSEGAPTAAHERLAPGDGSLPLEAILAALRAAHYRGDVEFEFVAEPVETALHTPAHATSGTAPTSVSAGYHRALRRVRQAAGTFGCISRVPHAQPAPSPGR